METIGYISAPTGAGKHYGAGGSRYGFRGRAPKLHHTIEEARAGCRYIEREGWRDGGRGRDCYIVVVRRTDDGDIQIGAGGDEGGLSLGSKELTVGCSSHVEDAAAWLRSRPARWQRERLGTTLA